MRVAGRASVTERYLCAMRQFIWLVLNGSFPRRAVRCDDCVMGYREAAQAVELIRAFRHQLDKMTSQLAWVKRQDVTARNGRACAMRLEAAALRRDIREAQLLIDRLARRYLGRNGTDIVSAQRQARVTTKTRASSGCSSSR